MLGKVAEYLLHTTYSCLLLLADEDERTYGSGLRSFFGRDFGAQGLEGLELPYRPRVVAEQGFLSNPSQTSSEAAHKPPRTTAKNKSSRPNWHNAEPTAQRARCGTRNDCSAPASPKNKLHYLITQPPSHDLKPLGPKHS